MLNICEVFPIRKNLIRNIVQTPSKLEVVLSGIVFAGFALGYTSNDGEKSPNGLFFSGFLLVDFFSEFLLVEFFGGIVFSGFALSHTFQSWRGIPWRHFSLCAHQSSFQLLPVQRIRPGPQENNTKGYTYQKSKSIKTHSFQLLLVQRISVQSL